MTDYLQLGNLDNIEGRPAGTDADGNQLYYRLLPKNLIELNIEIGLHHPKLLKLLEENLRDDAYSPEMFFGTLFAYCGIALDSIQSEHGYSVNELIEQGTRALINKREGLAMGVNTIPTADGLVRFLKDAKDAYEAPEAKEITLDTKLN